MEIKWQDVTEIKVLFLVYFQKKICPVEEQDCSYVMANGKPLNWAKIPLIPLKYNEQEIPLIKKVKTLQDGIKPTIIEKVEVFDMQGIHCYILDGNVLIRCV